MAAEGDCRAKDHFGRFVPEKIPYAIGRNCRETAFLCGLLDGALAENEFIAGDHFIIDMACYPRIVRYEWQETELKNYGYIKVGLTESRLDPSLEPHKLEISQ